MKELAQAYISQALPYVYVFAAGVLVGWLL
jgi:hypothetical protein